MTKQQAFNEWREVALPSIAAREVETRMVDRPGRAESWHNWVDRLQKDGSITVRQAMTWLAPSRVYKDMAPSRRLHRSPLGGWV